MRFCRRSSLAALLVVGSWLLLATPASAWSLIAKCGDPGGSPSCGSGIDTTGATLLVSVNGTNAAQCPGSGSPSAGSWTSITNVTGGGFSGTYSLCYINNPTGTGAGQTFACGGTLCGIALLAYSGNDTSGPLDGTQFCNNNNNNPSICASALTPSVASSMLVDGSGGPSATVTFGSSATKQIEITGAGGVTYGAVIGDLTISAASTPSVDNGAHDTGVILGAIFKPSGGGGGATPKCGSGMLLRGAGCEVHP